MTDDRFKRIEALFGEALEHPPAEREAFLQQAEPDNALRAEVSRLLLSLEASGPYFEKLADDVAASGPLEVEALAREQIRVGPYRTVRIIGHGGMGTVFLAERADGQFEQRVALKLIRLGMDTEAAVRRFLAERQIVARLDHPHIARLLDGGVSDDGRPYFVMEYVAGRPMVAYCDEHGLSIRERLELFLAVCSAVQYAHRHLVVHRDVKPANVLVTAEGEVKLLDFGIAKLVEGDDAGLTRTRERVLTPAHAAPEQIRGEPITTAADVYALGVLLYELVAGRLPHEPGNASPAAFERAVLEDAPPRPSQLTIPVDAASARASRPDRLRRILAGDLDTICLTALRKEPARRYGSVDHLAEDVRRHLAGLPIAARGDALGYRAAKFVRRHRTGVAVATASLLLVVGFTIALGIQSVRLARERDKAQQVAGLFVDLFELADPSEARGETITAREVLDRGVERIETELVDQPEIQADLLEVIGRVYQNLGLYARATPILDEVLAARRSTLGGERLEVAVAMSDLGELLRLAGQYDAAERTLRDALALELRIGEGRSAAAARTRNHLGKVLYASGQLAEAEQISRDAAGISRLELGATHQEVAESLNTMAAVRFAAGDDAAAEPLFRDALEIRRARLGRDHPLVAASLNNLAALLGRRGDQAAAEAAYREALDVYRTLFGEDHPRIATTLNNLALTFLAREDHASAEPLLRQSLDMRRRLLDPAHPDIAQSASNLGLLLQREGRLEESERLYREAMDIRRTAVGEAHPLYAQSLHNLGLLYQARGDHAEAQSLLDRSLELLRQALGPEHALVATNLHSLASLAEARGDRTRAATLYRQALEIRTTLFPPDHPDRQETSRAIAALGDVGN